LKNSSLIKKEKILGKLKNKSILLGVSGGVAAYKTVELVRRLKDEEASVTVIMTEAPDIS
jgi:phosphopantothenoylcysteine decarboxylase/phosphopantothenate--cysteine ligase